MILLTIFEKHGFFLIKDRNLISRLMSPAEWKRKKKKLLMVNNSTIPEGTIVNKKYFYRRYMEVICFIYFLFQIFTLSLNCSKCVQVRKNYVSGLSFSLVGTYNII